MTIQTTTQALKTFAGAAIFGLGLDMSALFSCPLTHVLSFVLREGVGLLFWGALASWQSSHAEALGHSLYFLSCPGQVVHALSSLGHFLGAVI